MTGGLCPVNDRDQGQNEPVHWSRGIQPLRAYWRQFGAFDRFRVMFSAILLSVMLILGIVVNSVIVRTATLHAAEEGAIFLSGFLQPFLSAEGGGAPLPMPAREALRRTLPRAYISEEHVQVQFVLIRIWSPGGELLYSSNESGLPKPEAALEAARNDAYIQIDTRNLIEDLPLAPGDKDAIGLVAPLHSLGDGSIVALLEAYQDRGFIRGELAQVRQSTWTTIGIVSALLLACLYLFAVRASRMIDGQRRDLLDHLARAELLAAENAALTRKAEASRRRIARSNDSYLERLGADIHDGPLQTLSAVLLALRVERASRDVGPGLRPSADPLELSLDLYDELREIASGLSLPDVKEGTLENAILQAAIRHERITGSVVDLAVRGLPQDVSRAIKVNCYRIVQEALTNAYKHAGGADQKVRAVGMGRFVRLAVSDAGPGIASGGANGGFGLLGIRNRVTALEGYLDIRSAPGRGTKLRVTLPISEDGHHDEEAEPV